MFDAFYLDGCNARHYTIQLTRLLNIIFNVQIQGIGSKDEETSRGIIDVET